MRENFEAKKLADLQVFKDFAYSLRDEIVFTILLDSELARHFKRKVALLESTEPTFAARVKRVLQIIFTSKIFACILTCYLIQNVLNSGR